MSWKEILKYCYVWKTKLYKTVAKNILKQETVLFASAVKLSMNCTIL